MSNEWTIRCRRAGGILCSVLIAGFLSAAAWGGDGSGDTVQTGPHHALGLPRNPLRLAVDEYHHYQRPDDFSQGITLLQESFDKRSHYGTDSTATSNGLFVFTQAIADDFHARPSTRAIGSDLSDTTDAYMLVCPETQASGNPHPITEEDAVHLERFVSQGGILILVHNSVKDPETDLFDLKGMNRIAGKFGMKFDAVSTRTMYIPIAQDHPVFSNVRGFLFGGGTTISMVPTAQAQATVLLESINPEVPGIVAVRLRYGKGTVLALGDAGSLGNSDLLRRRIGQFESCRQMFHCLLPEGPLPSYGWQEGMEVEVTLSHELAISSYPEMLRILDLPLDPATKKVRIEPRAIDLRAAAAGSELSISKEERARKMSVIQARARWNTKCQLRIGRSDGRAFAAEWVGEDGHQIRTRLTPRGQFLDSSPADGNLTPWRWALLGEIVAAPLDPQALPGDRWNSPSSAPLPHAQLHPEPIIRKAIASFQFQGYEMCRGRRCYVIAKRIVLDLQDMELQEFVDREYADYFGPRTVRMREGEQMCLVRTWIDASTRLPLRTELLASTGLVWTDRTMEDSFLSDHDWVTHEEWTEHILHGSFGRKLIAEFEY